MKKLLDYIQTYPHRSCAILGINLSEFEVLMQQIEQAEHQHQLAVEAQKVRIHRQGAGRPPKLSLAECMGLCLIYLRHNPTFEVLGWMFEVSRSEAHETFHWGLNRLRQVLPASLFEEYGDDPELWVVVQEILRDEVLLADSTEQVRERPSDDIVQRQYYSGKKKQHTQKTQILGTSEGREIVDVIAGVPGPTSDVNLLRQQQRKFDPNQQFQGDKAYVGAERTHTPHKKPRNKPLPDAHRQENRTSAKQRIYIEHLIGRLKVFQCLTQRFRLDASSYATVILAICGIVRLKLGNLDFAI
jgi:1,2-phenylacetyl-CoA epoxidase PaaB subunit